MTLASAASDYAPAWATDRGWWAVYLFLLVVVFLRAQGTYWLGRAAVGGALKTRWHDRFTGPVMTRAHAFLDRWGPIGVPVSFLTVGFQTAVQAAAGVARMRYAVYTLAMLPGCAAWAGIYTAIAVAAVTLAQNVVWWATTAAGVVLVAGVVWLVVRRRRSGGSSARTPR